MKTGKRKWKAYVCKITADYELGNTDVQIFHTKGALRHLHHYVAECGGIVELEVRELPRRKRKEKR